MIWNLTAVRKLKTSDGIVFLKLFGIIPVNSTSVFKLELYSGGWKYEFGL